MRFRTKYIITRSILLIFFYYHESIINFIFFFFLNNLNIDLAEVYMRCIYDYEYFYKLFGSIFLFFYNIKVSIYVFKRVYIFRMVYNLVFGKQPGIFVSLAWEYLYQKHLFIHSKRYFDFLKLLDKWKLRELTDWDISNYKNFVSPEKYETYSYFHDDDIYSDEDL